MRGTFLTNGNGQAKRKRPLTRTTSNNDQYDTALSFSRKEVTKLKVTGPRNDKKPLGRTLRQLPSARSSSSASGFQEATRPRTAQTKPSNSASSSSRRYEGKPKGVLKAQAAQKPSSSKPPPGTTTSGNLGCHNYENRNPSLVSSSQIRRFESNNEIRNRGTLSAMDRASSQPSLSETSFPTYHDLTQTPTTQLQQGLLSLGIRQAGYNTPFIFLNTVFDSSCSGSIITESAANKLGVLIMPTPPSGFERIVIPGGYFDPANFARVAAQVRWPRMIFCGEWNIAVVSNDFKRPAGAELIVGAKMIELMKKAGVDEGLCDTNDFHRRRLSYYPWNFSDSFSSELLTDRDTPALMLNAPQEIRDPNFLYPIPYPPGQLSASSIRSGVPSYDSTEMAGKTLTSTTSFSAMPPSQFPEQHMSEPGSSRVDDHSSFDTSAKGKDKQTFQTLLEDTESLSAHYESPIDAFQAPMGHHHIPSDFNSTFSPVGDILPSNLQSSHGNFSGPEAAEDTSIVVPQMESTYAVAGGCDPFAGQWWAGDWDESQQPE